MAEEEPAARSGGILAVLAIAGIVASLTQTLVIPLLGQLPQLLHTSTANATWVVTASLLVGAVVTPVAGRLGDLYGKRTVLIGSTVPLIVGSVVCALSSSLWPMVIGRGLQGMGVGIIPVGIAALRDLLPPARLGSGIALISSSLGIGGALGLPLSAAVVQYSNWRVLFWGVAVASVVVAGLIYFVLPKTPPVGGHGRFDVVGAVGLGAGLVCLLLGVSKGGDWGWGSGGIIGLFVGAVVVLLLWGWWELRIAAPLVDLRTTARPQVLMTNVASIMVGVAMYSSSLILPQLMQLPTITGYGLGQSMMAMGLYMAPGGLMMMLVSPVSAKLSALRGPKVTLAVGALIMAAGYGLSMVLMGHAWSLMLVTIIVSSGTGFAYGAMPALIMSGVPQSETAAANSFNTLMRSIGTSTASAVIGVVLAQMSITLAGHSIPTKNGFRTGLLIGCGVALVAAVVAMAIPVRRAVTARHAAGAVAVGETGPVAAEDSSSETRDSAAPFAAHAAASPGRAASGVARPVASSSRALPADGPVVFGRVRDASGVVPGATLTLISMSGRQLGRAATGVDGYYELTTPSAGSYVLIASGPGRRPDATTVTLGSRPVACDVLLTGMGELTGTVTRTTDRDPVPAARVAALDPRGEVLASAETDILGRFGLTELPEGDFIIAVSAMGFHPTAMPVRVSGSGVTEIEVSLRPGTRLGGVIRGRDDRPLHDAQVTLMDPAGQVVDTVTTGPDGTYLFGNLDDGEYTVVASGYAPVGVSVNVRGAVMGGVDVQMSHGVAGALPAVATARLD
ncbi:MFS transporter [Nocardia sp. NEAU-G5]|uniref:MFS transporter n=1 Tax=Nocardia albiluteola TaxID=2842303 RepID=A0ABS6B9Z5_9NOCA|nr:MFS transporter [Nocardia albiluteola]